MTPWRADWAWGVPLIVLTLVVHDCALGLGMVPRARRELAITHRSQLAAERLLGDADLELVPDPLAEVDDAPAHDAMDGRDRSALDHCHQRHAVPVIQSRRLPWRLAIDQALRATRVELEHPVTHDLQCHAADRGRLCPGRPIIDRRQCEKAAHLPGMLALTCRFTHPGCVEIGPQCDRHGEPPVFANLESDHAGVGESPNESRSAGPGISPLEAMES